jgi:hypothetical protein
MRKDITEIRIYCITLDQVFCFKLISFLLVAPVQTLGSKRFKLGATTSFLTRSLANHGLIE